MSRFDAISQAIIKFGADRDWKQFHDPKNLAEALAIECGELLEVFLWKDCGQSRELTGRETEMVREEVADIFIFLVYLADSLGIDLLDAVQAKIQENEMKYPKEKARGSSKKYSELDK
jgi:NTP pyrophosphatase (non-canonical NTP hydrolase)